MILSIIICSVLFALAAFAKAAMDTRVFYDKSMAYKSYPEFFRLWMQRRGTVPVIKIDDGWHMMQALCFLFTGIAYFIAGTLWPDYGVWCLLIIPLRTVVHGIIFEMVYPMT